MPTNPFFNNYTNNVNEQELYKDLTIEMIQMYGFDVHYLPRLLTNKDELYHENKIYRYAAAPLIEFYLKSVESFEGDGDFFSNLGFEIRDQMTLAVSIDRWKELVGDPNERLRPLEDDLIFWNQTKRFYRITNVDHEDVFYAFGNIRTYTIRVELLEYSGQRIETGIPLLDDYFADVDTSEAEDIEELADMDPFAKNEVIQDEADEIVRFDVRDPFSEQGRW